MKITVRPATAFPKIMIHRKVAAYCRVSTIARKHSYAVRTPEGTRLHFCPSGRN